MPKVIVYARRFENRGIVFQLAAFRLLPVDQIAASGSSNFVTWLLTGRGISNLMLSAFLSGTVSHD